MALTIKWAGPPKSYSPGRPRKARFVVLHYTAGAEGPNAAEDGAAYDRRRTDGVSTGYFTDSTPGVVVQTVKDADRSHTARYHGNQIGIHIEVCGTKQTREQWLDSVSKATLENTAALVAHLCKTHGFPARRLTTSEVRSAYYAPEDERSKYEGITDHNGCTQAFPEDGGTHTDMGSGFPWDVFLDMVQEAMEGEMSELTAVSEDGLRDLINTDGVIPNLPWRADYRPVGEDAPPTGPQGGTNQYIQWETWFIEMGAETMRQREALARIEAAIAAGPIPAPVEGTLSGSVTFTPDPAD